MDSIDLNCDMGEGFGVYSLGDGQAIMPLVSSANIACGFHASGPSLMHETVRLAKRHGVAVGAHPSYPDLAGFGRRDMDIAPEQLMDDLVYQIGALMAFCLVERVPLRHVKVHGALYNRAVKDMESARAIAGAVRSLSRELRLLCPPGSAMAKAAGESGVAVTAEAFADRAYAADGSLLSRSREGAVLQDPSLVARRALRMFKEQMVEAVDGTVIELPFQSICVHGDTPGSAAMIREIRRVFDREGIRVAAPGR